MRTFAAILVALAVCSPFVSADDFTLKNAAGETFGPFPIREGVTIQLDDAQYRIASITNTVESRLLKRLESIVIPEVSFKNASMDEVVDFLRTAARKNDPSGEGVRIDRPADGWTVCTWEGSREGVLRLGQSLTFRENVLWLEHATRLSLAVRNGQRRPPPSHQD